MAKRRTIADRMRAEIAVLRKESELEKKYLGRILGAAAQIADNQDRLIGEAAEAARDALSD